MPKVTKSLRTAWMMQRGQTIEEREFTQSGQPRDAASKAEFDAAIERWDYLLTLPVGAKF